MTADRNRLDDVLDTGLSTFFRVCSDQASGAEPSVAAAGRVDPPPSALGRLAIGEVLGRGGMAVVLRAHDPALDRDVAVKILRGECGGDAEMVERFLNEARLSSQLQHPGIVPIYDVGQTDDGRPFYTMKIVDGETLERLIAAK